MVASRVAIRKTKGREQIVALFRGRDEDLPILTRLYQATVPDKWADEPERLFGSELQTFFGWDELDGYGAPDDPQTEAEEKRADETIKDLAILGKMRAIIVLMLDSITATNTVTPLCLYWLNQWGREYLIDALIPNFGFPPSIATDGEYPNLTPIPFESIQTFTFTEEPFAQIITEARQVITGELRTARCEECENPFVFKRGESQRFCSHRCVARNGNRRRRNALHKIVIDTLKEEKSGQHMV